MPRRFSRRDMNAQLAVATSVAYGITDKVLQDLFQLKLVKADAGGRSVRVILAPQFFERRTQEDSECALSRLCPASISSVGSCPALEAFSVAYGPEDPSENRCSIRTAGRALDGVADILVAAWARALPAEIPP